MGFLTKRDNDIFRTHLIFQSFRLDLSFKVEDYSLKIRRSGYMKYTCQTEVLEVKQAKFCC